MTPVFMVRYADSGKNTVIAVARFPLWIAVHKGASLAETDATSTDGLASVCGRVPGSVVEVGGAGCGVVVGRAVTVVREVSGRPVSFSCLASVERVRISPTNRPTTSTKVSATVRRRRNVAALSIRLWAPLTTTGSLAVFEDEDLAGVDRDPHVPSRGVVGDSDGVHPS